MLCFTDTIKPTSNHKELVNTLTNDSINNKINDKNNITELVIDGQSTKSVEIHSSNVNDDIIFDISLELYDELTGKMPENQIILSPNESISSTNPTVVDNNLDEPPQDNVLAKIDINDQNKPACTYESSQSTNILELNTIPVSCNFDYTDSNSQVNENSNRISIKTNIESTEPSTINKENLLKEAAQSNEKTNFNESFLMPIEYLPKKKRDKFQANKKSKNMSAGPLHTSYENQLVKEKIKKEKDEKAAEKKKLQDERKVLAQKRKELQEQINNIQKKIKQEKVSNVKKKK